MARLILVCGPTGAGKTTYAISLARDIAGIRFTIDSWMTTLFMKDMTNLDYSWMMERVIRCYDQIWETGGQILAVGGNVVLDLGFTTKAQRDIFFNRGNDLSINPEIHYLDAPSDVRRQRVLKRNTEKDSSVYSFDVTEEMFDFMEPRFEAPNEEELKFGCTVNTL